MVARPQGGRPAAIFFTLGYPFPYGPATHYTNDPLLLILLRKHDIITKIFKNSQNKEKYKYFQ
jgi:hypothetical protein